jgi:hypothetical protein
MLMLMDVHIVALISIMGDAYCLCFLVILVLFYYENLM